SGARLRAPEDVAALQRRRDRLALDRGRLDVAGGGDGAKEWGREAEVAQLHGALRRTVATERKLRGASAVRADEPPIGRSAMICLARAARAKRGFAMADKGQKNTSKNNKPKLSVKEKKAKKAKKQASK